MVEIKFKFPVEEDAIRAHESINKFFQGSKVFENNFVLVNPIHKIEDSSSEKKYWMFLLDISYGEEDTEIEKYIEFSGGTLNLFNGKKQVWAIA